MNRRIVVTGAAGFVGGALVERLSRSGFEVLAVTRAVLAECSTMESEADLVDYPAWPQLLEGTDAIVHLAARAHVVSEHATDPLATFRRINVEGTRRILDAAVLAGVQRFVFLSSIGVLGNESGDRAFTEDDPAQPADPYSLSKWEAEMCVREVAAASTLETVIVRPPLVYGAGAKGNFLRLLKLVHRGLPLPFAGLQSHRSFLGLENLCGLLEVCIDHSAAAGQTLLAADGEDVTIPTLLMAIGRALHRPVRLFDVPFGVLQVLARLAGREQDLYRLAGSLTVNDSATRRLLGWTPGVPFDAGIRSMAESYLEGLRR